MKLTKRAVDRLKSDRERGDRHFDEDLPGFFVNVYASGRKTFGVLFGPASRRRSVTVGTYGPLTVEKARTEAKKLLGRVALGGNPAEERDRVRGTPTFGKWAETYVTGIKDRKKTWKQDERYLLQIAAKRWGSRSLTEITREDVKDAVRAFRETPIQGSRFLASVRACLEEARRSGFIAVNPAWDVEPFDENPPRSRTLTDDEMRRLLTALAEEKDPFAAAAIRLLVETGARRSELLRAKWTDFDLDAGTWRIPSPKAGIPQLVPLAARTVFLLRSLDRIGPFVILGRSVKGPRFDLAGPWRRAKARAKLGEDVHLHDLRRTFGLAVAKAANVYVASKLLRHADVRITSKVYAPLGLDDLRPAMEGRAAEVVSLEARKKAKP